MIVLHRGITLSFYIKFFIVVLHVTLLSQVGLISWKIIHSCVYTSRSIYPKESYKCTIVTEC